MPELKTILLALNDKMLFLDWPMLIWNGTLLTLSKPNLCKDGLPGLIMRKFNRQQRKPQVVPLVSVCGCVVILGLGLLYCWRASAPAC